jgi:hypothetical protein
MILPERVLGRSAAKRMSSGRAMAPIFCTTCSHQLRFSASLGSYPLLQGHEGGHGLALQLVRLPHHGRLGHGGVVHQRDSTSMVPIRCPATLSTSSMRPITQK